MRHQKIKKMLSDFMDDRLSSAEKSYITNHLKNCTECQRLLASFQQIRKNIRDIQVDVKPFFATRVLAEVRSRQREGFWALFDIIPRPVVISGLAVSILLLAIFVKPVTSVPDSYSAQYAMFYGDHSEITSVTDDQALAIAINADAVTNGE